MTTEPTPAPIVRLHKVAPWATGRARLDNRLRRTYREWFAEHGGRYFRVSAQRLDEPWGIEEIDANGDCIRWVAVVVRNLPAVRQAIVDVVAGLDEKKIQQRAMNAPPAPTGRAVRLRAEREKRQRRGW